MPVASDLFVRVVQVATSIRAQFLDPVGFDGQNVFSDLNFGEGPDFKVVLREVRARVLVASHLAVLAVVFGFLVAAEPLLQARRRLADVAASTATAQQVDHSRRVARHCQVRRGAKQAAALQLATVLAGRLLAQEAALDPTLDDDSASRADSRVRLVRVLWPVAADDCKRPARSLDPDRRLAPARFIPAVETVSVSPRRVDVAGRGSEDIALSGHPVYATADCRLPLSEYKRSNMSLAL